MPSPKPFVEAVAKVAKARLMPTTLSSIELESVAAGIRHQSIFSARVMLTDLLRGIREEVTAIVSPRTETREDGSPVTKGRDEATARMELKKVLDKLGYEPDKPGIQDLRSDARMNLVIETNRDMARGFGQFAQGQDPDTLDEFPCQELFRLEERKEPRDWGVRWLDAAGRAGDEAAASCYRRTGRMVARKDSGIWVALSRFDLPYPPYDFNSGMWTREIQRADAVELGVLSASDKITPVDLRFGSRGGAEAP